MNSMSLKLTINFLEFGGYPMEFNDGDFGGFFGGICCMGRCKLW